MLEYRRILATFACSAACLISSGACAADTPNLQQSLTPNRSELVRWKAEAQRVTVIRDTWGVPHVYGNSDADAVFGLMYAQAEDDFNRVEMNYIDAMGRRAEVEGESELYRDLRMKLFIDPVDMRVKSAASPAWLKKLMNGFADGLNYYLCIRIRR